VSSPSISLVAAAPRDKDFLYELFAASRPTLPPALFSPGSPLEQLGRHQFSLRDADYAERFGYSRSIILVEGRNTGVIWLHREANRIHIVDLAIIPDMRGHGVASQVLAGVLREALASNAPVSLTVERVNVDAIRLYLRFGFRIIEESDARDALDLQMEWLPPRDSKPTE
jgi:ribosomal protein S18 acetylase RimI-like enzyme